MKAIVTAMLCGSLGLMAAACGTNYVDPLRTLPTVAPLVIPTKEPVTLAIPATETITMGSMPQLIESSDFNPLDSISKLENVIEALVGETIFEVEVALTPIDRASGLMGRPNLPEDAAMLFVYDGDSYLTFWMKNTLIPLDILFLNKKGFVVDIQTMRTQIGIPDRALKLYRSARLARFALEINAGLADTLGIVTGTQVFVR